MTEYQCNARTSIILSKREGSCVATAECLFANTPMGLLRDAHVGSKAYINERTGVLFSERTLARDLSAFLEASGDFEHEGSPFECPAEGCGKRYKCDFYISF